jgi:hypothetical protein
MHYRVEKNIKTKEKFGSINVTTKATIHLISTNPAMLRTTLTF